MQNAFSSYAMRCAQVSPWKTSFQLSKIDRWFLAQIKEIVDFEEQLRGNEKYGFCVLMLQRSVCSVRRARFFRFFQFLLKLLYFWPYHCAAVSLVRMRPDSNLMISLARVEFRHGTISVTILCLKCFWASAF